MAKSSPEKLARALRANLKRRKDPNAQQVPDEGPAAKQVPERRPAQTSAQSFEKPLKISG
jgi:hypothetical protein